MPHYEVGKPAENGRTKKKRWSFGGLFKRKSKKETESSSDDEDKKKGFLRRKKHDRGSKDVTGLFVVQGLGRSEGGSGSLEGRKRLKAKVEASRELIESSSGEEGSYSSSLASGGGGSLNRRSRAARTERYMRRKCEAWSPSPPRKLEQRSVSEQGIVKKVRAPVYIPPPPPVRPPTVSQRSVSDQHLAPPLPYRVKPLPSLSNSTDSSYRDVRFPEHREPPTPPERGSSRLSTALPDNIEIRKRTSSNLEEALNELEAIYNSLRLGDDDYDRNLPYRVNSRTDSQYTSQNSLSKRRPDKVADDMAFRRWNKRNSNVPDTREIISQAGSYLLLSPTMTPPPVVPRIPNEPHITLDDVVYRNINHTNNTLRICDPQPPFGIPLGPVTPAPHSDYLHVSPTQSTRHLYRPDRIPDIVLDDLAFRNLRKDALDTTVNMKKKKATRSLSANLSNLIVRPNDKYSRPYYEVNNNLDDYKSQSYSDIPKDLRLAQRMLDIRLMNIRNKIKDQERAKINSSSETVHNSNRSASGTPERRTPTRDPSRPPRYGTDFKYSELHTPPDRKVILRDEWRRPPTPEKKSVSKEELRKKFFADAYRNLDKTKTPPKLTENPHHRLHQHSSNSAKTSLDFSNYKPPKVEPKVHYTVVQPIRRSPQKAVTGDFFFPKDFDVPKTGRNSPTLDELFMMYSPKSKPPPKGSPVKEASQEEKLCNGHVDKCLDVKDDDGRDTPSGEEVRKIMCPDENQTMEESREESQLLARLVDEAKATGLEMDRELQSLSVALPEKAPGDVGSRKVADLLRELTRSLDYDFGGEGPSSQCTAGHPNKEPPGSIVALAYCMALAQQLTSVDVMSLFILALAVISVFLFVYL